MPLNWVKTIANRVSSGELVKIINLILALKTQILSGLQKKEYLLIQLEKLEKSKTIIISILLI